MLRKAHRFPPTNARWIALLLAAMLAVVAGTGCAEAYSGPVPTQTEDEQEPRPPDEGDEQETKPHYTFAIAFPDDGEFWSPIRLRTEEYAQKKGWQLINCTDKLSAEALETLKRLGVDGIILSSDQAGLLELEADGPALGGIPAVVFGEYPAGADTFVGTGNHLAGRNIGSVIAGQLAAGERILIYASSEANPACAPRIAGIRSYLADVGASGVQIVYGEGTEEILAAMQACGQRAAVMAAVDREASQNLLNAYRAIGKDGAPWRLICFDDTSGNLQALRDGYVQTVVAQRQESWGEAALNLLRLKIEGQSVPETLLTGTVEITADNIDTYSSEVPYSE